MLKNKLEKKRKKVGLALGGGGAKGLAHIGVIKVLEKYGIPIDYIAGTSMGAFVGGWYAAHGTTKILENLFLEIDEGEVLPVRKIARNKEGILFSDKLVLEGLEEGFYGRKIEDCDIPFAAITTDVESGAEVVLRSGSLLESVRASISLPIIFKPVKVNGRLLMDGGFVNPVPADIVRKMGADIVIAIDVSSRWLNIEEESVHLRNIYSIISKTFSALEYQVAQRVLKEADIIMRPAVLGYEWLEFHQAKQIIAKGVDETEENIEEIEKKTGYKQIKKETLLEKIIDFYVP
jgi:NTE family protein